ncbi:hypothetical protein B0H16DRAFT_703918 [Mycena metata]|uniref:F-box domain-containing protein n=1 Tax=Mycena metata TaxID=1033252 RepID=A0AAD7GTZ5_9AGAR|nr:hypothetical protein B0H16DRAFT_703918 [Mycena metata]
MIAIPRDESCDINEDLALWKIGQVCSRWRAILWSRPSLWTVIDLDLSRWQDASCARLETQLQCSEQLPLRVTLSWGTKEDSQLVNMLVEQCIRWEKLSINLSEEADDWLLHQVRGRLPLLRELEVSTCPTSPGDGYSYPEQEDYWCDYFEVAPKLQRADVSWDQAPLTIKLPFQQLLQYRGADLQDLKSAYNLTDCALERVTLALPPPAISLPGLRRLSLSNSTYLDFIEAPVLQELYCIGPTLPITSFLQRHPNTLRKLFIRDYGSVRLAPDFGPLLQAASTLAHLGVRFIDWDHARRLYSLLTLPPAAVDMLASITICAQRLKSGVETDFDGLFMHMLESRRRAGILRSVNFSGYLTDKYASRMEGLRGNGVKITLYRKTDNLLYDLTPAHLRLYRC